MALVLQDQPDYTQWHSNETLWAMTHSRNIITIINHDLAIYLSIHPK